MKPGQLCYLTDLLFAGCSRSPLAPGDLAGTYVVNYPHGSEVLVLSTNGSFTQIFARMGSNRSIANSGTWEIPEDGRKVVLHDALRFYAWKEGDFAPHDQAQFKWVLDLDTRQSLGTNFILNPGLQQSEYRQVN